MNFDPWDFGLPTGDGEGQALEEGEFLMDVKGVGLEFREAVQSGEEVGAHGGEVLEALLKEEVFEIIA